MSSDLAPTQVGFFWVLRRARGVVGTTSRFSGGILGGFTILVVGARFAGPHFQPRFQVRSLGVTREWNGGRFSA